MKTVHLHGALATEFGGPFALDVKTPAEVFRALESYFPGRFLARIREGAFRLVRGQQEIDQQLLTFPLSESEFHIVPELLGEKNNGVGKAVVGAVIVATAVYTGGGAALAAGNGFGAAMAETAFSVFGMNVSYGAIAMMGVSMMLGGVSSMMTPTPKLSSAGYEGRERPEDRPSFIFNGAVNTVEQGGPVPLVYGLMRTGSVVISGSISSEKM